MKLFERVDEVAKRLAGSQTKLATILGLRQKQFNGYLNAVSERNLWEHLPAMLAAYPKLSREWLYFGEGEMLKGETPAPIESTAPPEPAPDATASMATELARLRAELDEERKLNRRLTMRLLGEDGDKEA